MPPHDQNAVAATLAVYDLAVIVQRPLDAAYFHDHRLGLTLDMPWATGLDRVYGAVMAQ
jgi:hypothetical protein